MPRGYTSTLALSVVAPGGQSYGQARQVRSEQRIRKWSAGRVQVTAELIVRTRMLDIARLRRATLLAYDDTVQAMVTTHLTPTHILGPRPNGIHASCEDKACWRIPPRAPHWTHLHLRGLIQPPVWEPLLCAGENILLPVDRPSLGENSCARCDLVALNDKWFAGGRDDARKR